MARTKGSRNKIHIPIETRFWQKVKKGVECWEWIGSKNRLGYGAIGRGPNGGTIQAHRLSYELHNSVIPIGMEVCHTCDNPSCVNPAHLWLGTHKENMRDRSLKGRFKCNKGEENPKAKLNRELVKEIRNLYKTGEFSHTGLAEVFNVSKASIYYIVNGKTWV